MSREEVEKYIEVGNPITRERKLIEMGNCVNCKSIDNRVSSICVDRNAEETKKTTI